jgi:hypothetical protein
MTEPDDARSAGADVTASGETEEAVVGSILRLPELADVAAEYAQLGRTLPRSGPLVERTTGLAGIHIEPKYPPKRDLGRDVFGCSLK